MIEIQILEKISVNCREKRPQFYRLVGMFHNFPLFQSHLDLAHQYWKRLLQEGDWAIDATCGRGRDTLMLATLVKGGEVIAMDIQADAIAQTEQLLKGCKKRAQVHLLQRSHQEFPDLAAHHPIKLIVYNLGYLPGGNKQYTTTTDVTLISVQKALTLLCPGGALSITCYPGHEEGAREEKALQTLCSTLPAANWNVCIHTFFNRKASPSLILIQSSSPTHNV